MNTQQPNQRQQIAALQRANVQAANEFALELEKYTPQLLQALPENVPINLFKRAVITAVSSNPELLQCDRRSLFLAAAKAAIDGVLPDGRQAVLLPFNTDVKLRDHAAGIDRVVKMNLCQYIIMIQGIRDRMRRTGMVASAIAEVVCKNDRFRYALGDHPFIEHEPPPLGDDRGVLVGAYAIIKLTNGEVIRDVMNRADIEKARNVSRAKNGPMWRDFYEEAARKTVMRRASKQAPQSADDREFIRLLNEREDDTPELPPADAGAIEHHQPEPQRTLSAEPPVDTRPEFAVVDLDGVEVLFIDPVRAVDAISLVLREAAKAGRDRLEGAWESNLGTVEQLIAAGFATLADVYVSLQNELAAKEQAAREAAAAAARQTRESAAPSGTPSQQQQATPEPAAGASVGPTSGPGPAPATAGTSQASGDSTRAPTDEASAPSGDGVGPTATSSASRSDRQGDQDETRQSMAIPMVFKAGKPDARTWAVALFAPKLKRQKDNRSLSFLLGDNEENLELARARLSPVDLADLNAAIENQWKVVG